MTAISDAAPFISPVHQVAIEDEAEEKLEDFDMTMTVSSFTRNGVVLVYLIHGKCRMEW